MKIRQCPGCAEFVHFDAQRPVQMCWNCALVNNFSKFKTPEEKLLLWLGALFEFTLPSCLRLVGVGKVALVVAMPIAVMMLLICNSFIIRIVCDPIELFFRP